MISFQMDIIAFNLKFSTGNQWECHGSHLQLDTKLEWVAICTGLQLT